jgi:hypothetical protein
LERVTFQDILVLYDNHIWLLEKARIDPQFQRKFGSDLESVSEVLRKQKVNSEQFPTYLNKLSSQLKVNETYLIPTRNIDGVERHFRGHIHIQPHREQGIPTKDLPPKPYIGVGYKDKGRMTISSYDGSPSWQEVASDERYRNIPETNNLWEKGFLLYKEANP